MARRREHEPSTGPAQYRQAGPSRRPARPRGRERSAGPSPRRHSTHSATSTALPTARPSGWSIRVIRATIACPGRGRCRTSSRPGRGRRPAVHERAVARLHVEHQAVDPLGQLLRHDRGRDQRDRLDGRRRVAEGVERACRPGRSRRSGRSATRPHSVEHRLVAVEVEVDLETRGSTRACRACRRCAPALGPRPSAPARRPPRRSAPGSARSCRRRRRCCACRPSGRGSPTGRRTEPDRIIASVRAAVSASSIPRQTIAISRADHW